MFFALAASIGVALISLSGALFFGNHPNTERLHRLVLPIAVGVFLGIVFFELIPETLAASERAGSLTILVGFLGFYLLSHLLDTYHHHHNEHESCNHGSARKLLIGDAIHNLADGVVIASAFLIDPTVGILTTLGIALHEIPQEIAEYAVLTAAGYAKNRALTLNLLSASTVIVGVVLTYALGTYIAGYVFILTGLAAGNLLYIATADLIPELRHSHRDHFAKIFAATLLGVILIGAIVSISHERLEGSGSALPATAANYRK